jgi:hypothetical protein
MEDSKLQLPETQNFAPKFWNLLYHRSACKILAEPEISVIFPTLILIDKRKRPKKLSRTDFILFDQSFI